MKGIVPGPQPVQPVGAVTFVDLDGQVHYRTKGVMRYVRTVKAAEAQLRNSLTLHDDTKAHRLGRCDKSCQESG